MDAFARLAVELEELPVVRAYVFGSFAAGASGPLSDVDVAILPAKDVARDERLRLAARISIAACAHFDVRHADVILLDEAPPAVSFEAIQGQLILDRDPASREVMEGRIMSEYHDRVPREARWREETMRRYLRGEFA